MDWVYKRYLRNQGWITARVTFFQYTSCKLCNLIAFFFSFVDSEYPSFLVRMCVLKFSDNYSWGIDHMYEGNSLYLIIAINKLFWFLSLPYSISKRNRKHSPCPYQVTYYRVSVWKFQGFLKKKKKSLVNSQLYMGCVQDYRISCSA